MKLIYYILIPITLFLCLGNKGFAQEKVKLSVGFGVPELLNIGVRIPIKQTQIGFSFGTLPQKYRYSLSFSGDFYMHFGGTSKFSDRHPWYSRAGFNYLRSETSTLIYKYLYFNLRIGREISISKKIGMELDIGPAFKLFYDRIEKSPTEIYTYPYQFFPSFGIAVFYRL